ncbi:MAG TPA: cysteine hydrolase [Caulobacteraceae bacterium]|jgi:nicotinamidase-related amidase
MYPSTLPRSSSWDAPRPWLICLDLQRDHVIPGRPSYVAGNADVVDTCVRVLSLARDENWRIVHSQVRVETDISWPRELFRAPIEGLRPLITEPVFFRKALSAFATPGFADELRGARGAEVYLIGFSLADTCLATAIGAVDAGLSLTLVEDAVGAGEAPDEAAATRTVLTRFAKLRSSRRLAARELEAAL